MNENRLAFERVITFIGTAVILGGLLWILPNFLRARAGGCFCGCQSNLKDIGTALEAYSKDNDNKYPVTLSALTPDYLKTIPTCPKARRDTYSLYYSASRDRKRYTFFCQGKYHQDVGISGENWPQYNSENGLVARP